MNDKTQAPEYWRSFDELAQSPEFLEFVENEFPNHAPELLQQKSRRHFLKTMGASVALAGMTGMTGCFRWPEEKIFPFTSRPEGRLPGEPVQYATAVEMGGVGYGLLATVYDGRPVKLDGNPMQSTTRGKSNSFLQATLLDLYDPSRSMLVLKGGKKAKWSAVAAELDKIRNAGGAGLHILAEPTSSEVVAELRTRLEGLAGFSAEQWHEYEPINWDNERLGLYQAFGRPLRPHYALERANVVVAIDDDLLASHPNSIVHANDFAKRRRPESAQPMGQLFVVESRYSVTGSTADVRLPASGADTATVLARLAQRLVKSGVNLPSSVATTIEQLAGRSVSKALFDPERRDRETQKVEAARREGKTVVDYAEPLERFLAGAHQGLLANRGVSLLTAGRQQSAAVHALVAALNSALGNVGNSKPLAYSEGSSRIPQRDDLSNLCRAIDAGEVQHLIILGANPVYSAPADLAFADKLSKVSGLKLHLGDRVDETARAVEWHVPRSHPLESWGEARGWDGTLTVQQPLLRPLYDSKSAIELLGALVGDGRSGHQMVQDRVLALHGGAGSRNKFWERCLHDGVVPKSSAAAIGAPSVSSDGLARALNGWPASPAAEGLELELVEDYKMYDGRFANNGWLQELPDPLTKIAWDNAALISVADAEALGLSPFHSMGDNKRPVVKLAVGDRSIRVPAFVMPGQAQGVVTLPLGYGRKLGWGQHGLERPAGATSYNAFSFAEDVGANGFALLEAAALSGARSVAKVSKTGDRVLVASTQNHYAPDTRLGATTEDRVTAFVREIPLEEYKKDPKGSVEKRSNHVPHRESLWPERQYGDRPRGTYTDAAGQSKRVELRKQKSGYVWFDLTDREGTSPTSVTGPTAAAAIRAAEQQWAGFSIETSYEHRWGMTIDLSVCTGCSACVTACTAENNVGVVGREEVAYGREMHWIRIDRYFRGDPANPQVSHQPLTCHHCENAPCEQVCPVGATMHSTEGLNDMVYNRCIGTRYCSNNCPYKVRRFNYFNNHRHVSPQEKMVYNPEVSVRHRGVMEKCTFCVQRINRAKIHAKNENRPVRDGEIVPACAQACPSDAITFGDLNDRRSEVLANQDLPRSYAVLEELNVKPRLEYLARVRNTQA